MGCARVYPKSDVPPARTASANGLRERISDETVPPARTALASGLREKISDETEPPARTALANRLCERISEEIVPEVRYCFTCKCSVFVEVIQIIGNVVLFK